MNKSLLTKSGIILALILGIGLVVVVFNLVPMIASLIDVGFKVIAILFLLVFGLLVTYFFFTLPYQLGKGTSKLVNRYKSSLTLTFFWRFLIVVSIAILVGLVWVPLFKLCLTNSVFNFLMAQAHWNGPYESIADLAGWFVLSSGIYVLGYVWNSYQ